MGKNYEGRLKDPSKEIEDLRTLAARLSMIAYRLEAEASLQYPPKHPVLTLIQGYHKELQNGITDITRHLEKEQDDWDKTSINGRLVYMELERRKTNAEKRMQDMDERGKIVSLPAYKARKEALKAQEPKGAA